MPINNQSALNVASGLINKYVEIFKRETTIDTIMIGEPRSKVHNTTMYMLLESVDRGRTAGIIPITYTILHRVIVSTANPEVAERYIIELSDLIPLIIEENITLDEYIQSGMAVIKTSSTGFITMNGAVLRFIDFTSTNLVKIALSRS
ncbi:hypothetical protein HC928_08020 [bacterium]|nr:hypothetical protein [bacterium]